MGMPPKRRARMPSGQKNTVCFASQVVSSCSVRYAVKPWKKSQFDVCGATIITNLGSCGIVPATRQPEIFMSRMPSQRRQRALTCGAVGGRRRKPGALGPGG